MENSIRKYVDTNIMPPLVAFKNTLESVGNGIKNDIQVVANQGSQMTDTIKTEMNAIKNGFISFGNQLKSQATGIANGAQALGNELVEVINEIQPSLKKSIDFAKKVPSRAKRWDWLGAFLAMIKSMEYLIYRKAGGQSAVIPELMEGFREISTAFKGLKNNFNSFGNTIKNQSTNIGNQIKTSSTNIKGSTDAFLTSFEGVFTNMSSRIKGGTGEVMKEIKVIKTGAPTPVAKPKKKKKTAPPIRRGGIQI